MSKKEEFQVRTKEMGAGTIELHEDFIRIAYPFRESIYKQGVEEHALLSLIFEEPEDEKDAQSNEALAVFATNAEVIPSLCYQDAELANKIFDVVELHFAEKITKIAESELPEDVVQEAKDMIMLEVEEMLKGNEA